MTIQSEAHFGNYAPWTFGWQDRDPEKTSTILVPFAHSGVKFDGGMNRDVVGLFTSLLDELVPHISGGLLQGQCGCYNPGSVSQDGSRSFHTYAIAIDLNWQHNPMNAPRPTGQYIVPDIAQSIVTKWGCEWGGDWSSPKDWMHIECHLSPADARAVTVKPPKEKDMTPEETETMIVQAMRAERYGYSHGPFTHKKYPFMVPYDTEAEKNKADKAKK